MWKPKTVKDSPKGYLNKLFSITKDFKKFKQKNDIFNRSIWDDTVNAKNLFVSYDITNYAPKKSKGFDHWDYAFRNASWHLTDVVGERNFDVDGRVEGFTDYYSLRSGSPSSKVSLSSPEETTKRIKLAAQMFGAGMVGVCEIDDRWIYSENYNRKTKESQPFNLPESYRYAILLVVPMDYELSKTYPSAVSGATTGVGYSAGLTCATTLSQFITNLGYNAVASLNDTGLNIPMAIQAGLGEYGRNGLLITPKYGPNIRIAKVFTDLPLAPDQPIEFGVKRFCETCKLCADNCPVKAIPRGEPTATPPNFSSHSGIKKWTVNAEKCFKFWVGMNTDCAICIRVCPYNKDYSKWWHRWGILLANSPFRKLLLWIDKYWGFGQRKAPETWWAEGKAAVTK